MISSTISSPGELHTYLSKPFQESSRKFKLHSWDEYRKLFDPITTLVVGNCNNQGSVCSQLINLRHSYSFEFFDSPLQVSFGYGPRHCLNYPSPKTFQYLLKTGYPPYCIWKTILFRFLSTILRQSIPINSWENSVNWIEENSDEMIYKVVDLFDERNERFLIVFDSLGSLGVKHHPLKKILIDLFVLSMSREFNNRICFKVFLTKKQYESVSKNSIYLDDIFSTKVDLTHVFSHKDIPYT